MEAPEMNGAEFIENPNAPIYRAHALHDLDFVGGGLGLFNLIQYRKTNGGVWYKETAFYVELPTSAIMPAISLTMRKMDRKSTRLNSSHVALSRMPSSA